MMTTAEVAAYLKVTTRRVRALKDRIGGWEIRAGVLLFKTEKVKAFAAKRDKS
jgi:hypothetical protein